MPYTISRKPLYSKGSPKESTEETAAAAWALVLQLQASDYEAKVRGPDGRFLSTEELKALANKEAN